MWPINYHFENKQNLYSQVVQDNWHWLDARMKEIALGCGADSNLFATRMFELLKSNSHQAVNSFKILLNEDIQIPTPLTLATRWTVSFTDHSRRSR